MMPLHFQSFLLVLGLILSFVSVYLSLLVKSERKSHIIDNDSSLVFKLQMYNHFIVSTFLHVSKYSLYLTRVTFKSANTYKLVVLTISHIYFTDLINWFGRDIKFIKHYFSYSCRRCGMSR